MSEEPLKPHEPKIDDTFVIGHGMFADNCRVISVEGNVVKYEVNRGRDSDGFFLLGSPQHRMARMWRSSVLG